MKSSPSTSGFLTHRRHRRKWGAASALLTALLVGCSSPSSPQATVPIGQAPNTAVIDASGWQAIYQERGGAEKILYSGSQNKLNETVPFAFPIGKQVEARYSAFLNLSSSGNYSFNVPSGVVVYINGHETKPNVPIYLDASTENTIHVSTVLSQPTAPVIQWKIDGKALGEIEATSVRTLTQATIRQWTQDREKIKAQLLTGGPSTILEQTFEGNGSPTSLGWATNITDDRQPYQWHPISDYLISPGRGGSGQAMNLPPQTRYQISMWDDRYVNYFQIGAEYTFSGWIKADSAGACHFHNYYLPDPYSQVTNTNGNYIELTASAVMTQRPPGFVVNVINQYTNGSCQVDDLTLKVTRAADPLPDPGTDYVINGEMSSSDGKQITSWTASDSNKVVTTPGWNSTGSAFGRDFGMSWDRSFSAAQKIPANKLKPNTDYIFKAKLKGSQFPCTAKIWDSTGTFVEFKPLSTSDWSQSQFKLTTGNTVNDLNITLIANTNNGLDCAIDDVKFGPVVADPVLPPGGDPTDTPVPPDMTYGSPIALEYPILQPSETAYFDVYRLGDDAYTGKNFRWDFGDGTTANGYSVKHDYQNPGTYTVKLNYENAAGQTKEFKTQVAKIDIGKVVDKDANNESLTSTFDAGPAIPGLSYEYNFAENTSATGSQVSHTYSNVGTFDYTLTIRDNRTSSTLTGQSLRAQDTQPGRIVFQKTSWHTLWQRPPTAKMTWTGSETPNIPLSIIKLGQSSVNVTFDATTSSDDYRNFGGRNLTYEWTFSDGQTFTGPVVQRTFTQTRPFLVTLKVKNVFGLTDTKRIYYHVRDFKYNTQLRTEYPGGTITTASLSTQQIANDLDNPNTQEGQTFLAGQGSGAQLQAQSVPVLSPDPLDNQSDALYPYVLPFAHNMKMGLHRPIRPATGAVTQSFCSEYKLWVNGAERFPLMVDIPEGQIGDPFIWLFDPSPYAQPATFCNGMVIQPGNIGRMPATGWNTVLINSSMGMNDTHVNIFHHLSVPRVMVTILPDALILGDQASPVVNEYHAFNPDTNQEELVVNVKIRESEVSNGLIKFKVPVLAVNAEGNLLRLADGQLNARFTNFSTSNEPVTMVDGKAYLEVTLNPTQFGPEAQQIDLTSITHFSSNNDCTIGVSDLAVAAKHFLAGCITTTATHTYPIQNAPTLVPQLPDFLKESRMIFGGHSLHDVANYKKTQDHWRQVGEGHRRNELEVIDFFVPILWNEKRTEYVNIVNRGNAQGYFTIGDRFHLLMLGLDMTVGSLPFVHGVWKGGELATDWIAKAVGKSYKATKMASEEAVTVANTVNKTLPEAKVLITDKLLPETGKILNDCNNAYCNRLYDDTLQVIEDSGRTVEQSRTMYNAAIKEVEDWTAANGYNHLPSEKMDNASLLTVCKYLGNSFSSNTLIDTDQGLKEIDHLKIGMRVRSLIEDSQKEGYFPITAIHQNGDSEATILTLRTASGSVEKITTTPRHLFYVTSQSTSQIGNSTTSHWIDAGQLGAGDQLRLADGGTGYVVDVTTVKNSSLMFNLTIAESHNFFVGSNRWLVHNSGGCDPLGTKRNFRSMAGQPAPLDTLAEPSVISLAKIRPAIAPYSVEEAASIIAVQVRQRLASGVSQTKAELPMYGITANTRTNLEVNSISSQGETVRLSQWIPNEAAKNRALSEGQEAKNIPGQCAEPQGCALLLKGTSDLYISSEYVTYAFRVAFVNHNGSRMIRIKPMKRCNTCSGVDYNLSPTDDFDRSISYFFPLE